MGNRPIVKVDSKVQVVCEQFVRMLHHAGLPKEDLDFLYSDGPVMNEVIVKGKSRMCLFTGSQGVAEKLVHDLNGRIKLEDAGFDYKILGPDVPAQGSKNYDFAVWQSDQDAYVMFLTRGVSRHYRECLLKYVALPLRQQLWFLWPKVLCSVNPVRPQKLGGARIPRRHQRARVAA